MIFKLFFSILIFLVFVCVCVMIWSKIEIKKLLRGIEEAKENQRIREAEFSRDFERWGIE